MIAGTLPGSEAKRGDFVLNVHTGEALYVVASTNGGCVAVSTQPGAPSVAHWERHRILVITNESS